MAMARNVVLLFDGTWNNRKDATNVLRLRDSIDSSGEHDPGQPCLYLKGVGTTWHNWLSGGLFGRGLSENIQLGYTWLAAKYQPQDRIFVLGFSRGAYSARSCVGLIRKAGLVNVPDAETVARAYELYRNKRVAPDDARAVKFRAATSREVRVRFVGVWDTVGALGVPLKRIPFGADYYRWHDTRLSKIVDHAVHAIAVDEQRKDYQAAVWTERKAPETEVVEQRWFVGAHSNVGGGYDKNPPDPLARIPLRWMQDKAELAGLRLRSKVDVDANDCLAGINDSYREMAFGLYRFISERIDRKFGRGVNEVVDPSVWQRWRKMETYRPRTLRGNPGIPVT